MALAQRRRPAPLRRRQRREGNPRRRLQIENRPRTDPGQFQSPRCRTRCKSQKGSPGRPHRFGVEAAYTRELLEHSGGKLEGDMKSGRRLPCRRVAPAALRSAAWRIAVLAFLLTTAGLIWRIALIGRPPVTNLYSSSLFVAWVAVGLGLLAERYTRDGIVTAAASALGFASLLIAHHLVGEGDTLGVLIAVLDSNFWLATHVIAITTGYAATFLAGFLGDCLPHPPGSEFSIRFPHRKTSRHPDLWRHLLCPSLQLCRHHPGRHLGRPILGPLLGLGPQGKRRPSHRPLECPDPPCPLGRLHPRPRSCRSRRPGQRRYRLLLVRHEPSRHRSPLLWLYADRFSLARRFHRPPTTRHPARRRPCRPFVRQQVSPFGPLIRVFARGEGNRA